MLINFTVEVIVRVLSFIFPFLSSGFPGFGRKGDATNQCFISWGDLCFLVLFVFAHPWKRFVLYICECWEDWIWSPLRWPQPSLPCGRLWVQSPFLSFFHLSLSLPLSLSRLYTHMHTWFLKFAFFCNESMHVSSFSCTFYSNISGIFN